MPGPCQPSVVLLWFDQTPATPPLRQSQSQVHIQLSNLLPVENDYLKLRYQVKADKPGPCQMGVVPLCSIKTHDCSLLVEGEGPGADARPSQGKQQPPSASQ